MFSKSNGLFPVHQLAKPSMMQVSGLGSLEWVGQGNTFGAIASVHGRHRVVAGLDVDVQSWRSDFQRRSRAKTERERERTLSSSVAV